MRKATRVDNIEDTPLITEGIQPPSDPTPTQPALTYKPPTTVVNQNRRFHVINSKTEEPFKNDKGEPIVFKSRNSAKQLRNRLNHKGGSGYYYVVRIEDEPVQAELDIQDDTEDAAGWEGWGLWNTCY